VLYLLLIACITTRDVSEGEKGDDTGAFLPDDTDDTGEIDPITLIDPTTLPAGDNPCREPILVTVDYVVDGDTAYVDTPSGSEKVRFIGVDTPEVAHEGSAAECYGPDAQAFTRAQLQGRKVWLTFDGECTDYYDRTLAYVHTGTQEEDFFERVLLRNGYAETLAIEPNTSFEELFSADERTARDADAGQWGDCP